MNKESQENENFLDKQFSKEVISREHRTRKYDTRGETYTSYSSGQSEFGT